MPTKKSYKIEESDDESEGGSDKEQEEEDEAPPSPQAAAGKLSTCRRVVLGDASVRCMGVRSFYPLSRAKKRTSVVSSWRLGSMQSLKLHCLERLFGVHPSSTGTFGEWCSHIIITRHHGLMAVPLAFRYQALLNMLALTLRQFFGSLRLHNLILSLSCSSPQAEASPQAQGGGQEELQDRGV
jgi:hypothetical protein